MAPVKQPEYLEEDKAQENFDEGMKALFKVSKAGVVKAEKKKRKSVSLQKPTLGDIA